MESRLAPEAHRPCRLLTSMKQYRQGTGQVRDIWFQATGTAVPWDHLPCIDRRATSTSRFRHLQRHLPGCKKALKTYPNLTSRPIFSSRYRRHLPLTLLQSRRKLRHLHRRPGAEVSLLQATEGHGALQTSHRTRHTIPSLRIRLHQQRLQERLRHLRRRLLGKQSHFPQVLRQQL